MVEYYLLENGTDKILLEDGSGDLLLESSGPFSQLDWPNPKRLLSFLLVSLCTIPPPVDAPFRQQRWDNPLPQKPNVQLGTYSEPSKLLLVGKDQFLGRAVLGQPIPPVKPGGIWLQPPNLQTSTLSPGATPFNQNEWTVPAKSGTLSATVSVRLLNETATVTPFQPIEWITPLSKNRVADQQTQNLLSTTLATTPVQPPFKQGDWTNPQVRTWSTDTVRQGLPALTGIPFAGQWSNPLVKSWAFDAPSQPFLGLPASSLVPFSQPVWENPLGKTWPTGFTRQTDQPVPVVTPPFFQSAWDNPLQPALKTDRTLAHARPAYYADSRINAQVDWPVPAQKPTLSAISSSRPSEDPVASPRLPFSWPNPTTKKWTSDPLVQTLLLTTLAPSGGTPFIQTAWVNPLPTRVALDTHRVNLSETTLIPSSGTPFTQLLWYNPVPKKSSVLVLSSTRPSDDTPPVVSGTPFVQSAWTNPLDRVYPSVLRSFIGYYVQDETTPPATIEWPLPLRPTVQLLGWTQSLQTTTLVPPSGTPLSPFDWPLPVRVKNHPVVLLTWLSSLNETLLIPNTTEKPFNQSEWFSGGKKPNVELLNFTTKQQDQTVPPPVPVAPIAWTNPLGKAYPTLLRGFIGYYVFDDSAPFAKNNWSNPVPRVEVNRGWTISLQSTTLAPVLGTPLVPIEWPNPPERKHQPLVNSNFIGYYVFDESTPFFQNEWPNPVPRKSASISLRTWTDSHQTTTLLPVTGTPFVQTNWPNPVQGIWVLDLKTQAVNFVITAPDGTPFDTSSIFRNPPARPFPSVILTLTGPKTRLVVPTTHNLIIVDGRLAIQLHGIVYTFID